MDIKWIDVTEQNASDTYIGAMIELQAAVHWTKVNFAEQLQLGKTEELRQDMITTVFVIENFLQVSGKTLACFIQEIKRLQQQTQHTIPKSPPGRFHDYNLN